MDWAVFQETEYQIGWVWGIVRIFCNNFSGCNDIKDFILLDCSGKHPFNGMPGKFYLPAIHL